MFGDLSANNLRAAWLIASFLPLPQTPNPPDQEPTTSRQDLENALQNTVSSIDYARYESARWWRKVNRIMTPVGFAIIAVVVRTFYSLIVFIPSIGGLHLCKLLIPFFSGNAGCSWFTRCALSTAASQQHKNAHLTAIRTFYAFFSRTTNFNGFFPFCLAEKEK